ncbi:MAG: hypothetical protein LM580_05930 [Thermofilum sp.]|jgi:simple sugar transport system permease protein|nr:hypothetical protein [Thermofilum sp.]
MKMVVLRRKKELKYGALVVSGLSLLLGLLIYVAIIGFFGVNPLDALTSIARAFVTPTVVKDLLVLSMLGYALLIAFKASLWNIGGEGQFYISMLPGIVFTLYLFNPEQGAAIPPFAVVLLSVIGGSLLAAAWAALAGAIKAYLQIDEVPVTVIMNYVVYYLLNFLVWGPLKGKRTFGYLRTDEIPGVYRLNVRLPMLYTSDPALSFLYSIARQVAYYSSFLMGAFLAAVFVWWVFRFTKLGLYVRIMGSNPNYLRATGVNTRALAVATMALSGAMVGLAGSLYLLTELGRLPYELERQTAGYGYLAVLVAWLSLLDYRLVPLSAYIVSALRNAGTTIQVAGLGGVEQTLILIGSVLLVYSLTRFLIEYEVKVEW